MPSNADQNFPSRVVQHVTALAERSVSAAESRLSSARMSIGAVPRRGAFSSSMMPRLAHGTEKSGFVAESCRGAHMSGGLWHCSALIIVDNVPPESIRAAAHDIACRALKVNILAVGTFAIN